MGLTTRCTTTRRLFASVYRRRDDWWVGEASYQTDLSSLLVARERESPLAAGRIIVVRSVQMVIFSLNERGQLWPAETHAPLALPPPQDQFPLLRIRSQCALNDGSERRSTRPSSTSVALPSRSSPPTPPLHVLYPKLIGEVGPSLSLCLRKPRGEVASSFPSTLPVSIN